MAWTPPITFVAGQVLTAAQMNVNVRDNSSFLFLQPSARVTRTAIFAIPINVFTNVPFDDETFGWDNDPAGAMHDNAVNNDRITIRTTGRYHFQFNAIFDGAAGHRIARIIISNAAATYQASTGGTSMAAIGGGAQNGLIAAGYRNLGASDYAFCQVLSSVAGTNLIRQPEESPFFVANRVGSF